MNWDSTGVRAMGIASLGHAVFAATMVTLGILGLIQGDFHPTWSGVPKDVPAREVVAYLCAFISLVSGIGLLWRRTAVMASRVLLASLLVWLLLRVTVIFRAPTATVAWWAGGDTAVMAAAAWVLYTWFAADWDRQHLSFATGDKGLRIARSEEHTSELQSPCNLVCRLLLEKKKTNIRHPPPAQLPLPAAAHGRQNLVPQSPARHVGTVQCIYVGWNTP